jgi:predicted exporter
MDAEYRAVSYRRDGSRTSALRCRVLETIYWALAIVVFAVYCGARSYGDLERWRPVSPSVDSREALHLDGVTLAADRADRLLSVAPSGNDRAVEIAAPGDGSRR